MSWPPTAPEVPALTPDEAWVLDAYRQIRDHGTGTMFIEFSEHRCAKAEVKRGAYQQAINALLGVSQLRD